MCHIGGCGGSEVVHRDARAGTREGEGDLAAEARARAGDERDLSVELRHPAPHTTVAVPDNSLDGRLERAVTEP